MKNNYKLEGPVFYYNDSQLSAFISALPAPLEVEYFKKGRDANYLNLPCSFDIETTSTTVGESKVAFMYIWQLGIAGSVIIGRTWEQFITTLSAVVDYYNLTVGNRRIIIYCHNLMYEFQFMRKFFEWDKVFALKNRKVLYAICDPIEFRCSMILSNYALAYLGNTLRKYPVQKMVGDLDYNLIRHSHTELSPAEIQYCINDVRVVMSYIQECIEEFGGIHKIPLTNTGRVRNYCREACLSTPGYSALMRHLSISGEEEYRLLKRAFMGGFTHANAKWVCKDIPKVHSIDLASDYPTRIVVDYYPMSAGVRVETNDYNKIQHYLNTKCCIFDLALLNVRPIVEQENILSVSRCLFIEHQEDYVQNNGRLVSCEGWIRTTCTEIDFEYIRKFYTYDDIAITNMYVYTRGYLPTPLVSCVLDLYQKKTSLKDVPDKEVEYMVSKNMINSSYGMMVTDIARNEIVYDSDWSSLEPSIPKKMERYNNNRTRFLFYPWGVYVTAHARAQIYQAILEFGSDYVYSDTDSIKCVNYDAHVKWVEEYNFNILIKQIKSAEYHKLPLSLFRPADINGKKHPIGYFEYEGCVEYFRTCGAKRYMYWNHDDLSITVAGLGKKAGRDYFLKTYKSRENIFRHFVDGLHIPAGETGKLTHTYIDEKKTGVIKDYKGEWGTFYSPSATHLEPAPFSMSMIEAFLEYLFGYEELQYTE